MFSPFKTFFFHFITFSTCLAENSLSNVIFLRDDFWGVRELQAIFVKDNFFFGSKCNHSEAISEDDHQDD
jgi:hypothetical protein